ncbi:ATPase involved in chromosome partitioning [Hahella chejuensis KCTC 2396]|uniref:non-specific protein-tyrosine kinase n=1 Tax=Hahella chejuensis (strain KCTC 2396) TaxID=349521 RepID=Q2SGQ0_HAHCH|nr:chain length determinant protein tyrosine kinase EpsG [Hahella chejuensis]ABC30174.1 ATPase involved in chromosome partitioning [Hahella chejuensis KCTC 2396]
MNMEALNLSSHSPSIGAILIDSGRLEPEAAEQILRLQQNKPGLRFGDAALQLGLLEEQDIQFALSRQFVYSYLQASDDRISQEVVAAFNPFSHIVEQLRALRSQLLLRWFDAQSGRNALSVVSANHGEGRSFVAANLAVVFSQLGQRTLMVDADLRAPRQHELFKRANKFGFSTVLADRIPWRDAVKQIDGLQGLFLMTAGAIPPNPQELLSRPRFASLTAELKEHYDIVIFDTPPGATVSDAQPISAQAGGALVVANQHKTAVRGLKSLVANLQQNGVAIAGSLLNKT